MTQTPKNPFVLPGLGQSPDLAGNPIMASMEMMRQAWSSLAGAGGLAQSMPITPPLSLEDLERRISDLRTVENWLQLNLSLLGSTIQGLEVQRATISTLRAFADGMSASAPGGAGEGSPLDVLLGIRRSADSVSSRPAAKQAKPAAPQAAASQAAQAPADKAPESAQAPAPGTEGLAAAAADATPAAANAWWNRLQQQFDTLAQATAASMPGMGAAKPAAKSAAQAAAKPGAKPASAAAPAAKSSAAPRKRATKSSSKPAAKPAAKRSPRKTVAGG